MLSFVLVTWLQGPDGDNGSDGTPGTPGLPGADVSWTSGAGKTKSHSEETAHFKYWWMLQEPYNNTNKVNWKGKGDSIPLI